MTPAIPFGDSDQFRGVLGTISVRRSVLEGLYEDTLLSIIAHGFDHLLVLGAHVPNQLTVLGFNLFGDWLSDYLDPRLRS